MLGNIWDREPEFQFAHRKLPLPRKLEDLIRIARLAPEQLALVLGTTAPHSPAPSLQVRCMCACASLPASAPVLRGAVCVRYRASVHCAALPVDPPWIDPVLSADGGGVGARRDADVCPGTEPRL